MKGAIEFGIGKNMSFSEEIVHETSFEKLGATLQETDGRRMWSFDEARHFWSQLGKLFIQKYEMCEFKKILKIL